jgi:hypothetical protein
MQIETSKYLKDLNEHHIKNGVGQNDFKENKRVKISDLHPNQKYIDSEVLEYKLKNKQLTIPYVLFYLGRYILIDGHHTVISKLINGQKFIYCKYLHIE